MVQQIYLGVGHIIPALRTVLETMQNANSIVFQQGILFVPEMKIARLNVLDIAHLGFRIACTIHYGTRIAYV
jgi:hypothetical protein